LTFLALPWEWNSQAVITSTLKRTEVCPPQSAYEHLQFN